jgi:pimeloyl-ACP methyl ester carboxylesterase
MKVRPAARPRKRWRRLLFGLGGLVAVGLLAAAGCSFLGPGFAPAIATPEMAADAIQSRFIDFGDERVHYVVAGRTDGPTILFVHGSPGTWEAWRGYLRDPGLGDRARLIAVDRLGFGGSARGHAEPALERQAGALAAVLQAESAAPAIVVGHSLGGPIAARLAVDAPARVSALVLLAPSIDPAQERHRWFNVAGSMRVVQWFLAADWTTSNREIWPLRGELTRLGARLAEVRCPVVILQGTKDSLVPPENSEYGRRAFTGTPIELRWIPGADHFIPWSHAGLVRTAILGLLDRQPHHSGSR